MSQVTQRHADELAQGAQTLGVALSPLQQEQLLAYLALLIKWNKAYNLTAVRDPDEMVSRLGFSYDFEPQDFAATLASVQSDDKAFTMAMSSNEEREQTYDFTRGYYQPLVGVLTLGGDPVKRVEDLAGKSIACTTGTVQNKFIAAAMPCSRMP